MQQSNSRVTMAEVAELAGVTKTTVSRVLNNRGEVSPETRSKVLAAVRKLGYRRSRLAHGLATSQTNLLGLVVPTVASEFFTEIIRGAEDTGWENGYKILLCNTENNLDREEDMFMFLQDLQADGVVICSPRLPQDRLMALVQQAHNVVIFNGQDTAQGEIAGSIETDEAGGMAQIVTHLVTSGRRHLAYLGGQQPDTRVSIKRYESFLVTLAGYGYQPVNNGSAAANLTELEDGYNAFKQLIQQFPRIDSVVGFNDLVAVGAMRACADMGIRVPDDIAITGCDDIALASLVSPTLTTLRTPLKAIGSRAIDLLLHHIQGQPNTEKFVIAQELVVRESAP